MTEKHHITGQADAVLKDGDHVNNGLQLLEGFRKAGASPADTGVTLACALAALIASTDDEAYRKLMLEALLATIRKMTSTYRAMMDEVTAEQKTESRTDA
jgi:hypothetical protein